MKRQQIRVNETTVVQFPKSDKFRAIVSIVLNSHPTRVSTKGPTKPLSHDTVMTAAVRSPPPCDANSSKQTVPSYALNSLGT